MQMAYDKKASKEVDAEAIVKSPYSEPYRYKCICCGEDVHLCAANSEHQVPHFRHFSGNNNNEYCENYVRNLYSNSNNTSVRQNLRDNIEFYFSNETQLFSIGVKFNEDEIKKHEQSKTSFQVRESYNATPIINSLINRTSFFPDTYKKFPISNFSWEYYTSISNDSLQQKYELFRKNGIGSLYPSFFKIQSGGDENNFQAKLVRTDTLYTNTSYFVIFMHQHQALFFQNQKDIQTGEMIDIPTMNESFIGIIATFSHKTAEIEQKLNAWNYKLEANETLALLWPPSSQVNDTTIIKNKSAYIFSSFELLAYGNIDAEPEDIRKSDNGISKVFIRSKTRIYKKNAELVIESRERESGTYIDIPVLQTVEKTYNVTDDNSFLFNCSGVSELSKGMTVQMTPKSEVRHYTNGYLDKIVIPPEPNVISKESLLQDALMHYKRNEFFNWDDFESIDLSQTAFKYIENCEKTEMINSAAKHFIEEGMI